MACSIYIYVYAVMASPFINSCYVRNKSVTHCFPARSRCSGMAVHSILPCHVLWHIYSIVLLLRQLPSPTGDEQSITLVFFVSYYIYIYILGVRLTKYVILFHIWSAYTLRSHNIEMLGTKKHLTTELFSANFISGTPNAVSVCPELSGHEHGVH